MARKRATAQAAATQTSEATSQPTAGDAYDQAAERHEQARQSAEQLAESTRMPEAANAQLRKFAPDPINFESVSLTDRNGGPKMTLYRSNRRQELAIHFDEKPDAKYTAQLREAGFHWDRDDAVWKKPIVSETKWKDHLDAEKTFNAIANAIRADNGLEPTKQIGVS
ncbi:hypothetical protein [Limnoglobus roseus]|uniref:Uncharacterized protein n=1 Tax=Limnoglobus roseus TaxID=2598579 RepID=A0A5C1AK95_9BACT|nr:hypothetical protein [Limnoglobus roseus]QEL19300.1 hypothetical protein PX52LOC_06365 [Limnoglobus roseus]